MSPPVALAPIDAPTLPSERAAKRGSKTLIVLDWLPFPNRSGATAYLTALSSALVRRGHDVEWFVPTMGFRTYRPAFRLAAPGIVLHVADFARAEDLYFDRRFWRWPLVVPGVAYRLLASRFGNFVASVRVQVDYRKRRSAEGEPKERSRDERQASAAIVRIIAERRPDVVFVNYARSASLLDELNRRDVACGVVAHDVLHQRSERLRSAGLPVADEWDASREAHALSRADLIVAIHAQDAQALHRLAPEADVVTAPHPVATSDVGRSPGDGACLFVGSDSDHNRSGMRWFLDEIWPIVLVEAPHASLRIVGTVGPSLGRLPRNAVAVGRIHDLTDEYRRCDLALAPLPCGSGLKIKCVEALAHGRTCVMTSVAAEGIADSTNAAFPVANDPKAFAREVVDLLRDGERRHAAERAALALAADRFGEEACIRELDEWLRRHVEEKPS